MATWRTFQIRWLSYPDSALLEAFNFDLKHEDHDAPVLETSTDYRWRSPYVNVASMLQRLAVKHGLKFAWRFVDPLMADDESEFWARWVCAGDLASSEPKELALSLVGSSDPQNVECLKSLIQFCF